MTLRLILHSVRRASTLNCKSVLCYVPSVCLSLCVCVVCVTSVRGNLLMLVVMVMTVRLILHSVRRALTLNCKSVLCYVPSVCLSLCVCVVCVTSVRGNLLMLVVMVMTVRLILHSVRRALTLNCKSVPCYVSSVCLSVGCVCVTSVRDNLLMLVVMVMTVRLILHSVRRALTLNCKSVLCYVPSVCLSLCVLCLFNFFTSTQQSFSYAGRVFLG